MSKPTDEEIIAVLKRRGPCMTYVATTRKERIQSLYDLKIGQVLKQRDIENIKMLARMALGAMDSEPVAWQIHTPETGVTYVETNSQSVENIRNGFGIKVEIAPLYRHAQQPVVETVSFDDLRDAVAEMSGGLPMEWDWTDLSKGHQAVPFINFNSLSRIVEKFRVTAQPTPVVTFYRDGIEAAAKWIDKQREAYDSEHGWSDPDTGAFEFGNDAQREYSSTLEELAEGIRALHPNAGNSPVIPEGYVMVPKEPTEAMMMHNSGCQHHAWDDPDCAMRQTRRLIWSHMLTAALREVES